MVLGIGFLAASTIVLNIGSFWIEDIVVCGFVNPVHLLLSFGFIDLDLALKII